MIMYSEEMPEPREYTEEEVCRQFLETVWTYIDYWHNLPDKTCRGKLEGLAFSLMAILDGVSSLPSFVVAPVPHPGDKKYNKEEGENWYPQNHESDVVCDISGSLHDEFHKIRQGDDNATKRL
jgi:hypothetical protein